MARWRTIPDVVLWLLACFGFVKTVYETEKAFGVTSWPLAILISLAVGGLIWLLATGLHKIRSLVASSRNQDAIGL